MAARDASTARASLPEKKFQMRRASASMVGLLADTESMLAKPADENAGGKVGRGATEIDLESPDFNMMEQFEMEKPKILQVPKKLNKKILKTLESCTDHEISSNNTKVDDIRKKNESDLLMKEWIAEFTAEIDEIDNFYMV
jgi:hypothetical protein